MSQQEEKHKGNLTVTVDYLEAAQAYENLIFVCNKTIQYARRCKDILDVAAIEKGMIDRERRYAKESRRKNYDRRNGNESN